ncbi:hypothetical protein AWZ03_012669 [Drosophila navojoa]|uniref:Uncharacterized protein n=1 Tax=Drosophila navojoa TaxID=7232 RepID=A0A484AZ74_DRONA|nr:hypothetical protein AWZ03_012669 [Drosophila navojoa]
MKRNAYLWLLNLLILAASSPGSGYNAKVLAFQQFKNGSISHTQLLDTLPNEQSTLDSEIALKILKGSLFMYNSKCLPRGISGDECWTFLATKPLPEGSALSVECNRLLNSPRTGHHAFRRLLPRHYKNGFHEASIAEIY